MLTGWRLQGRQLCMTQPGSQLPKDMPGTSRMMLGMVDRKGGSDRLRQGRVRLDHFLLALGGLQPPQLLRWFSLAGVQAREARVTAT